MDAFEFKMGRDDLRVRLTKIGNWLSVEIESTTGNYVDGKIFDGNHTAMELAEWLEARLDY